MSEESTTTIKFGSGYEAPWFVAKGDVETQKQEVCRVFGLSPHVAGKTLAEYIVDASIIARALVRAADKAASEGYKPETTIRSPKPPEPESAEPADSVGSPTGIAALIQEAKSIEELNALYGKNKDIWTAALSELARVKKQELTQVG